MDLFKKIEWFEKMALEMSEEALSQDETSEYTEELESQNSIKNRAQRLATLLPKKS